MTSRTEPATPSTRQNLLISCLGAAQTLIATLPVTPLDVAIAHLGSGFALIVDPAVVDREKARQILVDLLAAFDADGPAPESAPH